MRSGWLEQAPFRLGFRVCDRRFPFLWDGPGQQEGRWNRVGDQPVHYLASTPTIAWAEWLRHQEIEEVDDLAGIAASLWAVLIPASWTAADLPMVDLELPIVLDSSAEARNLRLACVDQLKQRGAKGLRAPSAALHDSEVSLPCVQVDQGAEHPLNLPGRAEVILIWIPAHHLPGWCCVPQGRPGAEVLPLVRHQGR